MSPAARDSGAVLTVLLAEVRKDRAAIERQETALRDLVARWADVERDTPLLAYACVLLHGWYTGLETLYERVARGLDSHVPVGDRAHRALLRQMAVELPGVRAALVSETVELELVELLKFRHFFRHAYDVALDPQKVRLEAERVARIAPEVTRALVALEAMVEQALAVLATR